MNLDINEILKAIRESKDVELLKAVYDGLYDDRTAEIYDATEERLIELGELVRG